MDRPGCAGNGGFGLTGLGFGFGWLAGLAQFPGGGRGRVGRGNQSTLGRRWRRDGSGTWLGGGCRNGGLPFATEGELRLLVLVLGTARRASDEANGVGYHRDDRVIADAALSRTVVIDDVTNPWLALLHARNL
jgi:hypothetical protein